MNYTPNKCTNIMWGVSIRIDVSTQHNGMRRLHFAAIDVAICGGSIELWADPNRTDHVCVHKHISMKFVCSQSNANCQQKKTYVSWRFGCIENLVMWNKVKSNKTKRYETIQIKQDKVILMHISSAYWVASHFQSFNPISIRKR